MADNKMEFPKTFEEFVKQYGFIDDKEVYTNASWLIPVNRVLQWNENERSKIDKAIKEIEHARLVNHNFDDRFIYSKCLEIIKKI